MNIYAKRKMRRSEEPQLVGKHSLREWNNARSAKADAGGSAGIVVGDSGDSTKAPRREQDDFGQLQV